MRGVLLDSRTGRPEGQDTVFEGGTLVRSHSGGMSDGQIDAALASAPLHVKQNLERAAELGRFGPRATRQGFSELLNDPFIADGAQVLNSTSETIMVPDVSIPASSTFGGPVPGKTFRYLIFFDTSTVVTTPGTVTFRLRWGGVGGTALVASAALTPKTTVSATFSGWAEFFAVVRGTGNTTTAGSIFAMGRCYLGQNAGGVTDAQQNAMPQTAPAVVSSLDFTVAKALSPTVQFSVATATTQLTSHISILQSLN